jgi:PAS domain S-box-containing protein
MTDPRGDLRPAPGGGSPLHPESESITPAVIVLVLDSAGVIRSISDSIVPVAGYSTGELVGRPGADLIHPQDRAVWTAELAVRPAQRRSIGRECRLRHRDGEWIPIEIAGVTPLRDPALPAVVITLLDRSATRASADRWQWLRLAIEQSPAAVLITDLQGRIQYVNRRFTEMSGYLLHEVLGQTPRLLKSGLTPPTAYAELWTTIAAGGTWRGELCNRRKDGELYWHSSSISPMRDAAGRVTGFVGVQEDVTDRRRTQEALVASERRYRRIVDTAAEGIWQVDAEHRTTFVSQSLAAMLGYSVEEMLGRPVYDFTDDEGRVIAEASRDRRRRGIRERLDFKLQRRDGSALWALMSTGPILDEQGRYTGALAMVTDMTARRDAEEALRRSEAWFRALIEGAQDLISVLDVDGTIRYASPSFERGLGYRSSELEGRLAFDFVHPEDLERVIRVFGKGVQEPGAVRTLQYRFRHANGTWRQIEGLGRNLFNDPVVHGAVVSGRDVTERATLEAQLRQAQKMEAVGRLVGGVAHDFNNILTVILGAGEAMRQDLGADHPSQEDLLEIQKAGGRAAALTRQLLAFSRQQILMPRVLDLNDLVRNMQGMLVRLLGEDIDLQIRVAPAPLAVTADPGQLEQVLLNLAVNSRDAMPDGGRLLIETAAADVDNAFVEGHEPMRPGPHALLVVSDTGVGMSRETQARAFEPFFTTKEPGKGTGLGLATVYGIVKQSEGFIWLYSEPRHGTTFKVYLPRVRESPGGVDRPPSEPERLGGSETVLVVEDNPAVRLLATRALRRHGYGVLEASGADALDTARREDLRIDLLLTDVVMSGISGPDLATLVRAIRPGLPVLYMSGYADALRRTQVAQAGRAFLPKPFTITDLARKVREVLDHPGP